MDMDLRDSNMGGKDVLGENILHKYYNMVYYDAAFTEDGKAKVKEIFTDLVRNEVKSYKNAINNKKQGD